MQKHAYSQLVIPFCIPYLEKAEIQETHYFMLPEAQASLLRAKDGSYHILVFEALASFRTGLRISMHQLFAGGARELSIRGSWRHLLKSGR